jgi:hypothetical protein
MNRDMDEDTRKGNHAIAVFMYDYYDTGLEPAYYIRQNKEYRLTEAQYHSSWDWLMTAIDKIETLEFKVYIGLDSFQVYRKYQEFPDNFIIDADFKETRLENAFDGVAAFAEWWEREGEDKPALEKYSEFQHGIDEVIKDLLPDKILFKEENIFETEIRPGKIRRWYPVYSHGSSTREYLEGKIRARLFNVFKLKDNL